MKYFYLLMVCLCGQGAFLSVGCGGDEDTADSGDGDGIDSNGDTQPLTCDLSVMETFDSAIPAGWTVLTGGSGSGSGSGSGTVGVPADPTKTWHQTADQSDFYQMQGGYMFVGGVPGLKMNEALITPYYNLGACASVNLSFKQYFDDLSLNLNDRGEVWFMGDAPVWSLLTTYNSNADKIAVTEPVSLPTAGNAGFQLKFVFADETGSNYGWAIDDVSIIGAE
jgi:hypothetical protein